MKSCVFWGLDVALYDIYLCLFSFIFTGHAALTTKRLMTSLQLKFLTVFTANYKAAVGGNKEE